MTHPFATALAALPEVAPCKQLKALYARYEEAMLVPDDSLDDIADFLVALVQRPAALQCTVMHDFVFMATITRGYFSSTGLRKIGSAFEACLYHQSKLLVAHAVGDFLARALDSRESCAVFARLVASKTDRTTYAAQVMLDILPHEARRRDDAELAAWCVAAERRV